MKKTTIDNHTKKKRLKPLVRFIFTVKGLSLIIQRQILSHAIKHI